MANSIERSLVFREIYDITRNWEQRRRGPPLIAAAPFADERSAATVNDFRLRQRSEDCAGTFLNLWSERATFLRHPRRGTRAITPRSKLDST